MTDRERKEIKDIVKKQNDLIEVTIQDTKRSAKIFTQVTLLVHEANKIIDNVLEENENFEEGFLSDELLHNALKWKERAQVIAHNIEETIKYA